MSQQQKETQKFFHKDCGGELKMIMFCKNGKNRFLAVCQKCGASSRKIKDLK